MGQLVEIYTIFTTNQLFYLALSCQSFGLLSSTEYTFGKELNVCFIRSCDVFFMTHCLCKPEGEEKEQRIGWMSKLEMEQMGFMKITVERINRTDDSGCRSIHANTF